MTKSFVSDYLNAGEVRGWKIISTNYIAFDGDKLLIDTSTGSLIVTLPPTPAFGFTVEFSDGGNFAAVGKPLVVTTGNSFTIQGTLEDLIVDTKNASFALTFDGTDDWRLTEA